MGKEREDEQNSCTYSCWCFVCSTTAKFVYPTNAQNLIKVSDQPKYNKEVAVLPFEEMRGSKNSLSTFWLYMVPLMPYGYLTYERPDAARMFNTIVEFDFDVTEDLAKAAAVSLRRSGLFKDCYFTFGGEKSNADLFMKGEVLSTKYKGTIYSYCLSVFGPALWFFGLPAGSSQNHLTLHFSLWETASGKKIWEYRHVSQKKIIQGLYYKWGHDVKGYSELMESAMNACIKDLDKKLGERIAGSE